MDDEDPSADRRIEVRRPDRLRPSAAWLRDWVAWFGTGRLAVTVLAIVGVAGAGWWLVRSPGTPVESVLPKATAPATLFTPSTPPPTTAGDVAVHVAGAVRRPGVYALPPGSRVIDAIDRAGGMRGNADADAMNLAAVVADGSRVYVPLPGEIVPAEVTALPDPTGGGGLPGAPSSVAPAPVDINESDAAALETLPGIGPATAAAIVEYRDANGPFATVDDLEAVPGIGPAKLEAVRPMVVL